MQETQETWVQSLGWEDPLEEGMATHFTILAWRIPQTEEPGELQSVGLQRFGHDWSDNAQSIVEQNLSEDITYTPKCFLNIWFQLHVSLISII